MSRCRALSLLALLSGLLLAIPSHSQPAGALGENFIYRVRQGDTLINIAATYTRNQANWSPLQSLNQVATPERLPIGLELRIPLSMIPERAADARVVHVSGQANLDGQALKPGANVAEGSKVVTAPNGFVTLELADGSKLTLPADGAVELTRLRQFDGTDLTDSVIHVERGSVESSVAPGGQGVGRFEVRTPVAVTGVRGTRFRVQSGNLGVHSEVLEGSVRLQPHAPGAAPAQPVA
ncbi:FecR domain-containing protein, partial [Achromobacter sp.]|uniref:FecR family protein n=1 Tax=Achromobacter sp. TaxID=134375 RepID=UPI0025904375